VGLPATIGRIFAKAGRRARFNRFDRIYACAMGSSNIHRSSSQYPDRRSLTGSARRSSP